MRFSTVTSAQLRTIQTYHQMMNINALSHLMRTASDVGIIAALDEGQKSAEELSEALGLQIKPTTLLLSGLCRIGLIEKYGELYALSQAIRLIPPHHRDFGDRYWTQLSDFVRSGRLASAQPDGQHDPADYLADAAVSEWLVTPAAIKAAELLRMEQRQPGLRVIDLGAGSAVLSMTILHGDPKSHVIVVDSESALSRARATARSIGREEQVDFVEGDYRQCQFAENRFDLIIMENILHREPVEVVQSLLNSAFQSLKPSGRVAILDVFPGIPSGEISRAIFELLLAMRLTGNELHTRDALEAMAKQAGFDKTKFHSLDAPPHIYGLLIAAKS
jgi:SAM-dependent methyltransferase